MTKKWKDEGHRRRILKTLKRIRREKETWAGHLVRKVMNNGRRELKNKGRVKKILWNLI